MSSTSVKSVTVTVDGLSFYVNAENVADIAYEAIKDLVRAEAYTYYCETLSKSERFKALIEKAAYEVALKEFGTTPWVSDYMDREIRNAVSDAAVRAVAERVSVDVKTKEPTQ